MIDNMTSRVLNKGTQSTRPVSYSPKSVSTQADVVASYQKKAEQGVQRSQVRVENVTDETNYSIKTAVQQEVRFNTSSTIKAGQRLSEAFLLARLSPSISVSNDAKTAIREVKRQTEGGRPDLLKEYLSTKPTDEKMRFKQEVVKRQLKSSALRDDIKATLKKTTLKESGDSIKMEMLATYHETMLKYAKRPQTFKSFFSEQIKTSVIPSIGALTNKVGGVLSSGDDTGSQAIGMSFTAGQTAVEAGKVFGKAFISVGKLPFAAANKISKVPENVSYLKIIVRSETGEFVQSVQHVSNKIKSVIDRNVTFAKRAKRTIQQNGLLSKPVFFGTLRTVSKPVKEVAQKGVLVGGRALAHTTTKGAVTLVKGGIPTVINGTSAVAFGVGSALGMSEDDTVRGAGTLMTGVGYGIKTGVTVTKTSGFVVKTAVKTTTKAVGSFVDVAAEGAEAVSLFGVKDAIHYARNKMLLKQYNKAHKSVEKAAQEAEKFVVDIVRNFKRYSVAALAIVVVVAMVMSIIMPVSVIGGTFSGTFSTVATVAKHIPIIGGLFKDVEVGDIEEFDISEYLSDTEKGLPKLKSDYIEKVVNYWNRKDCHYLRIRTEGYSGVVGRKDTTGGIEAAIRSAFYSDDELVDIISPIFNAIILTKYDLQPTDKQAEKVLKDIFNSLFPEPKDIPNTTITEYCGQNTGTGKGDSYKTQDICACCNRNHNDMSTALDSTCPNYSEHTHSAYSCSKCDTEWVSCQEIEDNGGEGTNVVGLHGEKVSWGEGDLLIYGHWTGVCYEVISPAGDGVYQYQTFRQHGCPKLGQPDKIIQVTLFYKSKNTHGAPNRISIQNYEIVGSELMLGGITYYKNEDCNNSKYHFACDKYYICGGHTVITLNFNLSGYDKLIEENFNKRIKELTDKGIEFLDNDEQQELQSLKDGKELAEEYLKLLNENTIEKSQLKYVEWAVKEEDLSDTQRDERNKAISQVGKIGGKTYIDWYYNQKSLTPPKEVNWSGCFVCWVKQKPKFANPMELDEDEEFEDKTSLTKSRLTEEVKKLESGDIVFFNVAAAKKKKDRCGYVIGRDDDYLYVIEGYRFDTVQIRMYAFDDARIVDYSKSGEDYWK